MAASKPFLLALVRTFRAHNRLAAMRPRNDPAALDPRTFVRTRLPHDRVTKTIPRLIADVRMYHQAP